MLFEDIEKDNLSGAADILINAGKQWRRLIEESSHISVENLRQQGLELLSRQPGMAPLFNLVNAVLLQTAKASSGNDTAHLAVKALDDFIGQTQSAKSLLTEQAEQVLKDHRIVATTSHSSIVISVLLSHFKKGNKLEVMVGESRPMHEGRSAATKLAKAGIPITLFVDAAMSLAVQGRWRCWQARPKSRFIVLPQRTNFYPHQLICRHKNNVLRRKCGLMPRPGLVSKIFILKKRR